MNFYIIPKVGTGSPTDPFRPKYLSDPVNFPDLSSAPWSAMDYGIEPTFLVAANTSAAQHATLSGFSDVDAIPNLNTTVGGNPTLSQTQNKMESRQIPGAWITATTLWREVTGKFGRFCMIAQRLNGRRKKRIFPPGVTLDSNLTTETLGDLSDTAQSFGISVSLTTSMTVRDALMLIELQMPFFRLGGEIL